MVVPGEEAKPALQNERWVRFMLGKLKRGKIRLKVETGFTGCCREADLSLILLYPAPYGLLITTRFEHLIN